MARKPSHAPSLPGAATKASSPLEPSHCAGAGPDAPAKSHSRTPSSSKSDGLGAVACDTIWFTAPTLEMEFIWRFFGFLLLPKIGRENFLNRAIQYLLVTPTAHFANASLEFQIYLYEVFHTTTTARVTHAICLPLTTFANLAVFARYRLEDVLPALYASPSCAASAASNSTGLYAAGGSHCSESASATDGGGGVEFFVFNGAFVVAFLIFCWYVLASTINRLPILAISMAPLLFCMAVGATALHSLLAYPKDIATWYAPAPLHFNPFLWIVILSAVLVCSHLLEPMMPPPLSGSESWVTVDEFYFGPKHAPYSWRKRLSQIMHLLVLVPGSLWDEHYGSWRLMPIAVLDIYYSLGWYTPAVMTSGKAFAKKAWQSGNPSLNFIGVGGSKRWM